MKISVVRKYFTDISTIGELFIDGVFNCFVLEDCDRRLEDGNKKIDGQTAIPRGTYKVVIDFSNRFQRRMPHILDVPGFEGIRIHSGNSDKDVEGCLCVGTGHNTNVISNSRAAFNTFFEKLRSTIESGEDVTITIS